MSDTQATLGPPVPAPPNQFTTVVGVGQTIVPGNPLYRDANGQAALAKGDSLSHCSTVIGIAVTGGAAGDIITVAQSGRFLSLGESVWHAVGASSGGLVPGDTYYVSPSTAGDITTVIPTGSEYIVPLGVAVTATQLQTQIGSPVLGTSS